MEFTVLQKISPYLVFALSIIFAAIWSKTLFVTVPILVTCLQMFYPGSYSLQIGLGIFWILLLVGECLEITFPLHDVRLISVNERIDTKDGVLGRGSTYLQTKSTYHINY